MLIGLNLTRVFDLIPYVWKARGLVPAYERCSGMRLIVSVGVILISGLAFFLLFSSSPEALEKRRIKQRQNSWMSALFTTEKHSWIVMTS